MDAPNQEPTSRDLQERVQALTEENLQLRDQAERLFTKVGYLESRLGHLTSSSTDVSHRLVQSEEEKLKISKELVEEKLQTNKLREQYEEQMFELKNKILSQDGVITELEVERDKLLMELQSTQALLKVRERKSQNLTEENATLMLRYQALAQAQRDELSSELLSLAQTQDFLRKQLEEQQQTVKTTTRDLRGDLDRVRALISRMSDDKVKLEDLAGLSKEFKSMEETLLGNQDEIKVMLEKMRSNYEEQQQKLEEKVLAMSKTHPGSKRAIPDRQQEVTEQRADLMCCQIRVKEVEEENSKLQLQLKELNEEYRWRLVCYLQDLAEYVDGLGGSKSPSEASQLREFVDRMLQDVRSSYRVREEQLASAARTYKKRLQKITKTHHAFLLAYRAQREQILANPDSGLDPGPPEASFSQDPTELRNEPVKEFLHLHQDEARQKGQLKEDRDQVGSEAERALLITRATIAEAQASELQHYVDNHLGRYKEEISRLCRLVGKQEAGRSQSANSSPC